jgi:hypothetical protein
MSGGYPIIGEERNRGGRIGREESIERECTEERYTVFLKVTLHESDKKRVMIYSFEMIAKLCIPLCFSFQLTVSTYDYSLFY